MIYATLLPLLISFLGLALGYLFTFLAPEEVRPGERYFRWLKRALLVVFFGVMVYDGLIINRKLLLSVILIIAGVIIWGLDFTGKDLLLKFTTKQIHPGASELATYAYFVLVYFLLSEQQLLLASIIFLYGLPAGTLWRKRKN